MSGDNNNVVFRRINGRVIPMRTNESGQSKKRGQLAPPKKKPNQGQTNSDGKYATYRKVQSHHRRAQAAKFVTLAATAGALGGYIMGRSKGAQVGSLAAGALIGTISSTISINHKKKGERLHRRLKRDVRAQRKAYGLPIAD